MTLWHNCTFSHFFVMCMNMHWPYNRGHPHQFISSWMHQSSLPVSQTHEHQLISWKWIIEFSVYTHHSLHQKKRRYSSSHAINASGTLRCLFSCSMNVIAYCISVESHNVNAHRPTGEVRCSTMAHYRLTIQYAFISLIYQSTSSQLCVCE